MKLAPFLNSFPPQIQSAGTDGPFPCISEQNYIVNNFLMPMDPPLPLAVAQEETRPHPETNQLVLCTPHRPCWRTEDGEMVCGTQVLLEDILPFPVQATTHHGGHPYVLVCPPLPRNLGARMVCGSALASPLSCEEGSELVCGGVWWGRTAQSLPHQTSNTTGPSSAMWNNLKTMDTQLHTTQHYILHLLQSPRGKTTPNTPVAVNAHFSHKCHSSEERECMSNSRIPREAVGDPPLTQQLVPGRMA